MQGSIGARLRRWAQGFLALAGAVFFIAAAHASADKRVALVIGNSAYRNVAALANPSSDAASIAAMLKSAGFDVVESKADLDNNDMRRAIRDFTVVAQDADIAVIYYAGHGIEVNGTNYLVPIDAMLERDIDVEDEAVSLDRLMRALEPVKNLRLVILDACRDNPFAKSMKRSVGTRSVGRGLAEVNPDLGNTLVAFAAKAGSTASDGGEQHSPFTEALLKNIPSPGLDIRLALGRVRDEVFTRTKHRQEPFVYGSLGGNTVALVPETKQPAVASSDNDARADYKLAERIDTVEAWDTFMAAHPSGFYYNLAKAARDKAAGGAKQQSQAALAPGPAPHEAAPDRNTHQAEPIAQLAGQLRLELKRVGCDPGRADGPWDDKAAHALADFNANAHTGFDVEVASLDALDAIKQHTGRVCPLICGKGFRADAGRCIAAVCRRGFTRDKNGDCIRDTRSAQHPPDAAKAGSGEIACDKSGCRTVPKNCHVESHGAFDKTVCD